MFKRILVPTDGSAASLAALEVAAALAQHRRAELFGLRVTPLCPVFGAVLGSLTAPDSGQRPEDFFDRVTRRAAEAGLSAALFEKRADAPGEAVLDTACELHRDMIVMGSRGRSPVHAMSPGSQAHAVPTRSPKPLLAMPRAALADG